MGKLAVYLRQKIRGLWRAIWHNRFDNHASWLRGALWRVLTRQILRNFGRIELCEPALRRAQPITHILELRLAPRTLTQSRYPVSQKR